MQRQRPVRGRHLLVLSGTRLGEKPPALAMWDPDDAHQPSVTLPYTCLSLVHATRAIRVPIAPTIARSIARSIRSPTARRSGHSPTPLTAHRSPLTPHPSPLTPHPSPLTRKPSPYPCPYCYTPRGVARAASSASVRMASLAPRAMSSAPAVASVTGSASTARACAGRGTRVQTALLSPPRR